MACGLCGAKRGHMTGCPVADSKRRDNPPQKPKKKTKEAWISITCPTCKGSGKRGIRDCGLCNGRGKILVPKEPSE